MGSLTCTSCKHEKPVTEYYKNSSKKSGYHNLCKCCHKEVRQKSYKKNFSKIADYQKGYRKTNRGKLNEYRSMMDQGFRQPISEHFMSELQDIYHACPPGMEVDHIYPVSKGGLHVPWNLQYLTPEENKRKSARVDL